MVSLKPSLWFFCGFFETKPSMPSPGSRLFVVSKKSSQGVVSLVGFKETTPSIVSKKGFPLDHDLVGQTLIQERITFPVISLMPGQVSFWFLEPGHHYQEVEKGNDSSKPYLVEKRCGFSRRAHDPIVVGSNPTSARSFY